MTRRKLVAVIGRGQLDDGDAVRGLAELIGRGVVDRGHALVTGGLGGVMACASRGGRSSETWSPGGVLGVIPGSDRSVANPWVDTVIPSGLGVARNVVVAHADAVIAVGGGAGTLSEMAIAWQLGRPIIALRIDGWSGRLAGQALDDRSRPPVMGADDAQQALACLDEVLGS
jgi:hypothetical protein